MKKFYAHAGISLLITGIAFPTFANTTWGDSKSDMGALTISGALRANYQDTDYNNSSSDRKVKFDAAILRLGYESPRWFGSAEYRCYQYDTLCDFSTLVYGYTGYHINQTDNITFGLQAVPFGPGRYWDSSFYAGINNTMGLQDVLNLGVNYHAELPSKTKLDLAYFAVDGGNYKGESRDAARYTANLVSSSNPTKTDLNEKNMLIARVNQNLNFLNEDTLKVSVGGSYWYSEIKNRSNNTDGNRKAWSLFSQANYQDFAVTLTGGKLNINNKDGLNFSTLGSFDTEYEIANEGYFYTVDARYTFKNVKDSLNITPYLVFSGFNKTEKIFDDSERNIVGIAFDYKNTSLYTEYVMSKNDTFIGGSRDSLASGDDGNWNKLLNIMFVYSF